MMIQYARRLSWYSMRTSNACSTCTCDKGDTGETEDVLPQPLWLDTCLLLLPTFRVFMCTESDKACVMCACVWMCADVCGTVRKCVDVRCPQHL